MREIEHRPGLGDNQELAERVLCLGYAAGLLHYKFRNNDATVIDASLSDLVGMDHVREILEGFAAIGFLNRIEAFTNDDSELAITSHLILTGNPGTGKTTVARIVGRLYKELGLLANGELHEVSRADLVGQYRGHTEKETRRRIEEAVDGVLFVDEAYNLMGDSESFGRLAMDQILLAAENQRHNLVIILAGYPTPMKALLGSNPGLLSRFPTTIDLPDYTNEYLEKILEIFLQDFNIYEEYQKSDTGRLGFQSELNKALRSGKDFGNARWVRNFAEQRRMAYARSIFRGDLPLPIDKKGGGLTDGKPKSVRPAGFAERSPVVRKGPYAHLH